MPLARLTGTVIGLQGLMRATDPLEIVAEGSIWAEGPLWIPARGCLRWSDIPNNRIREYEPASGVVRDYATDAGFANGWRQDVDGSVVQCSHGRRRVERDRGGLVSAIGVIVFDPRGAELGWITVPELTGNLCFGGADGHDLYIAASTCIYRIRTNTHAAWPQDIAAGDRP
jgi:sugar lactone lactonase YvrE